MKTGLFFGSFNPIHIGHLVIANYMVEYTDLDKLWFVVSPRNPLKNAKNLLNEYDRLDLVRLAIEGDDRMEVSNVEFNMPRPSYTIDTLTHLQEKFPNNEFVPIMGTDTALTLPKWKNHEALLENFQVYVYPRPDIKLEELIDSPSIHHYDAPLMKISASFIRRAIKQGKSIKYMVPDAVIYHIDKWGFYSR
jgi:nicotinate-nucleotide adenylyltransferase